MSEPQPTVSLTPAELIGKVQELQREGYRLVQIGATRLPDLFEVNYSFDRDLHFLNFRLTLASAETPIPSISGIYWSAFLYENEIHDLFGLTITGIAVDYKGKFYQTSVPHPFAAVPVAGKGS